MKLRIHGASIRLRLQEDEVAKLAAEGRLSERCRFGPAPSDALIYSLELSSSAETVTARFAGGEITVTLPEIQARAWATGDEVGIRAEVETGVGRLAILVEKDLKKG